MHHILSSVPPSPLAPSVLLLMVGWMDGAGFGALAPFSLCGCSGVLVYFGGLLFSMDGRCHFKILQS
jgi:hypothetical protein